MRCSLVNASVEPQWSGTFESCPAIELDDSSEADTNQFNNYKIIIIIITTIIIIIMVVIMIMVYFQ